MRGVHVRLLGTPAAWVGDRQLQRPRGRKCWAVLARVALADRPVSRRELARLLFFDADDPLGALRWSLAELRRAFEVPDQFRGELLALDEDRLMIDARVIDRGGPGAARLCEQAGELLEGIELGGCPEFNTWLAVARQHLHTRAGGYLRDAAMHALASGDAAGAVRLAGLAVSLSPYDEPLHELLVRSLARGGDQEAALGHARRAERMLTETLGVRPSDALRTAASDAPVLPAPQISAAVGESLLTSARTAVGAGAVDVGIQTLQQALVRIDDPALRGRALLALGTALVHAARGRNEEGAVVLHEALLLSQAAGDRRTATRVLQELAFVDIQVGRVATVDQRLDEAARLAGDVDELAAGVLGLQGMHWSDRGDPRRSLAPLAESVERADRSRQPRQLAWSQALTARSMLLLGRFSEAMALADQSVATCRQQQWQAFLPFPMAVWADAALNAQRTLDHPERQLHAAFALGCQLGDPCWEGAAARGLAIVDARRDNLAAARATIADGYRRCMRHADSYVFVQAWVLAADVALARAAEDCPGEKASQTRLRSLARRTEQPWFLTDEATSTAVPVQPPTENAVQSETSPTPTCALHVAASSSAWDSRPFP